MVGSSKILTVSYGTFSCTLEGFDDSFSTMKAIAEYFRDLASDDRYFGAEPPTPDAEMLARIAEREISRRVEARTSENGIVLRAASALNAPQPDVAPQPAAATPVVDDAPAMPPSATRPAAAAVTMPAASPAPAASPKPDQTELLAVSDPVAADKDVSDASSGLTFDDMSNPDVAEIPTHPDVDSVAAKLQRIRAVVSKGAAAPAADTYAEDQHAAMAPAFNGDIADQFAVSDDADIADAETMDDIADAEADDIAMVDDADFDDDMSESEDMAFEDDADDMAFEDEAEVTVSKDEAEDTVSEDDTENVAEVAKPLADVEQADDAEDVLANITANLAGAAPATADKPVVRARIVRLRKDVVVGNDTADATKAKPAVADNTLISSVMGTEVATPDAEPAMSMDAEDMAFDDVEDVIAADMSDDEADDMDADADIQAFDEDEEDEAAFDDAEDDLEDDDADFAFDDEEEDEDDTAFSIAALDGADELMTMASTSDDDTSDLSDADEADLQEELAEVAREVAEMPIVQQRPGRASLPDTDDAAMSRILTQTDEALSEPEGSRRRNAIAQLKAAVAATEAARQLGDHGEEKDNAENAFREDLNDVVRPARPSRPTRPVATEDHRVERPRPAPLKLVASQRVDAPSSSNAAPVMPRRVAMSEPVMQSDAASFAEFAAEMGATELPDLLEAAAAYTAFVEGVEDFSRPQIMKKVQLTTDQTFSREDGLRSFGTLLRQGRISKVRNGRFQVSEQTRFRPEQRAG